MHDASPDPFAPPRADLTVQDERGPIPRRAKLAVIALAAAFTLGLLMNAAVWSGLIPIAGQVRGDPGQILSGLGTFLLYVALIWKIYQGRNWARWILAIIVGLGLIGLFVSLAFAGNVLRNVPSIFWVGSAAQTVVQVAAVAMLFTGDSARWFRP